MDESARKFGDILDEAERGRLQRAPWGVSAGFLEAVEWLENLPCNRSGQDKSWVLRSEETDRSHFVDVRRSTRVRHSTEPSP